MKPVSSKAIAAIGYEAKTRTMRVRFNSGPKLYDFPNFDASEHAAFVGAASIGQHYHAHIRGRGNAEVAV
jgi:hypothetical protein